jgi:type VI secretion system secreted protein VgrG
MQHFAQVSEQKIEQQGKSVPGYSEPILILEGQGGIAATSPSHTHIASGEHTSLTSGQDTNLASGKNLAASIHDNLSLIAGNGVKLYGAEGRVDIQAQANTLEGTAKQTMKILSVNSHIDFAAAKSITLICGGAYIKLEGGNIQSHCPGKITIKGAKHSLTGPTRLDPNLPGFPTSTLDPLVRFRLQTHPGAGVQYGHEPYKLYAGSALIKQGLSSENGTIEFRHKIGTESYTVELVSGQIFEVKVLPRFGDDEKQRTEQKLANQGYRDEPAVGSAARGRFRTKISQRASYRQTRQGSLAKED